MIEERYYVVEGYANRFGIVDRTKLPLVGVWCHLYVTTSRSSAQRKADELNQDAVVKS